MVMSAALLIREHGAQPTAMADVIAHSGAPRGSAYHYFPGGRTQLICEAVDYAGNFISAKLARGTSGADVLDALVADYSDLLVATDYRAGCPIVAVTVEAGDPQRNGPVLEHAAKAFRDWTEVITRRLIADGMPNSRAEELAILITASIEGAIVLCRALRDVTPLDVVHRRLRELLTDEATPSQT